MKTSAHNHISTHLFFVVPKSVRPKPIGTSCHIIYNRNEGETLASANGKEKGPCGVARARRNRDANQKSLTFRFIPMRFLADQKVRGHLELIQKSVSGRGILPPTLVQNTYLKLWIRTLGTRLSLLLKLLQGTSGAPPPSTFPTPDT